MKPPKKIIVNKIKVTRKNLRNNHEMDKLWHCQLKRKVKNLNIYVSLLFNKLEPAWHIQKNILRTFHFEGKISLRTLLQRYSFILRELNIFRTFDFWRLNIFRTLFKKLAFYFFLNWTVFGVRIKDLTFLGCFLIIIKSVQNALFSKTRWQKYL